jgi:hypothetical protein
VTDDPGVRAIGEWLPVQPEIAIGQLAVSMALLAKAAEKLAYAINLANPSAEAVPMTMSYRPIAGSESEWMVFRPKTNGPID